MGGWPPIGEWRCIAGGIQADSDPAEVNEKAVFAKRLIGKAITL